MARSATSQVPSASALPSVAPPISHDSLMNRFDAINAEMARLEPWRADSIRQEAALTRHRIVDLPTRDLQQFVNLLDQQARVTLPA